MKLSDRDLNFVIKRLQPLNKQQKTLRLNIPFTLFFSMREAYLFVYT